MSEKGSHFFSGLTMSGEPGITRKTFCACLHEIETPRLVLRRMRMKDAKDIHIFCSDPEVSRYVLWDAHTSMSETKGFIRFMRRLYRRREPASWCIEYKETGKVIGTLGFVWVNDESDSAEIGYSLAHEYWGRGIMTEAVRHVIRDCFEKAHFNRIEAQHDTRNPASGRVMEKCGMQKEGVLRSRFRCKREYADVAVWSILASDYQSSAKRG